MAPVQYANAPVPAHDLKKPAVPLSIFPDGLKTTGQHEPIYESLRPFSDFPKEITGPTVWKAEDYRDVPEKWTHRFTEEQITELSEASDRFIASSTPLTGISKVRSCQPLVIDGGMAFLTSKRLQSNFPLPGLASFLVNLREDLIDGKGFILFKGLPVEQWGNHKSAVAYMGLGTYLGYFVSQNSRGHVLGHVKDLGEDSAQIDKVRIYRTNARYAYALLDLPSGFKVTNGTFDRQYFHADDGDIVGLLCIAKALEGGESDLVSSHHVYNVLAKERPDVLEILTQPIWHFDRKGETSVGQKEYIRTSVLYLEPGGKGRVYTK